VLDVVGTRASMDCPALRCRTLVLASLVLLCVVVVAGCGSRRVVDSSFRKLPVDTYTLPNGLTVYTARNTDIPLVTLDAWVKVGAGDEPAEIAGISHFLEHMLFKGTPRLGVGDYDRRIEGLGGYLNAATSSDYTHYYITLPSEHLEVALTDMADVLRNSLIDEGEVERERSVILEEIAQKQDNPIGFLYDQVVRASYITSPYMGTVIGGEDAVSAITRDQIREHYRRYYTPDNMALVVAGDFDPDALRELIERLFGDMDRQLEPWRETLPPTEFSPPQAITWDREWSETYFLVTFPGGAVTTPEELAILDVTEGVLFGGRSARIVNSMREKKGLVRSISGLFQANKHPGVLAIYGTADAERLDEVLNTLFDELEEAARGGISSSELQRAKRQIVTNHLYGTERNTGRASMLGYSYLLFDSPVLLNDYPKLVDNVSAREIGEVLDRFTRDNASVYVARPAAVGAR